eukprot:scaffold70864_cov48-Phaeocystis_antarctica.AAC.1
MAILVVVSVYFFNLNANLNSWLGVLSVGVGARHDVGLHLVYMNIAIKMPQGGGALRGEVGPAQVSTQWELFYAATVIWGLEG